MFITNAIEEIKRNIKIKKKIRSCTFEDFCKEDKISLLVKIISNDEVLSYLYEKIFKRPSHNYRIKTEPVENEAKFPNISGRYPV